MHYHDLFKLKWERSSSNIHISADTIKALINTYNHHEIENIVLSANGCANSNYKITFKDSDPVILRIYLRDPSALAQDLALMKLIDTKIPVPRILHADVSLKKISYPYAILQYMPGRLLRDVICEAREDAIAQCSYAAGKTLSILREIKFAHAGFFQAHLTIRPFAEHEEFLPYIYELLNEPAVKEALGESLLIEVNNLIINNLQFIPNSSDANLVHGDYDPSNILVTEVQGKWQISAVLDWEFAHAGTFLLDAALFLRYASFLPKAYETNFVKGIVEHSSPMPEAWKKSAKLMDLLCLLQLLYYYPKHERPNMHRDIVHLISTMLNEWHAY